ncbi:MAG: c-type cytochrome, partial [Burkholderiales bacterium]|nr:c-type cytochrome [Burkholderiales bacterium]
LAASASVAYALVRVNHGTSTVTPSASVSSIPSGQGARLFNAVGCAKCHVPSLRGVNGDVPLYSGQASGAEWRTTPLIGTRLRDRYLHDGRAASLRDAVLEHGGEGEIVRRRFFELDEDEQKAVFAFVASL